MFKSSVIRNLRISLDLSQKEFSKLLGITQAHLSFIECGKRKPSYKISYLIKKIAKSKGINISLEDIVLE